MKRGLFTGAAIVLFAAPALAQRDVRESARSSYFEFRLGFYRPDIDSEFKKSPSMERPFEAAFGDGREALPELHLERHFFQRFGTLSGGLGVGYWTIEGESIAPSAGVDASDSTELTIVPLQAQLSYRLDYFEDTFPLVPILRGGLDYYLWRILDGAGNKAKFANGNEADGGTWGWHYTFGVHLLLDFLAPEMAADFDRDAGVNGSYLTFEYQIARVDDFGSADSFRLGDSTFYFGLTLDF